MSGRRFTTTFRWSITVGLLTCVASGTAAQSVFTLPARENVLTFEVTKPEFNGDDNASFTTSASFVGLRVGIGANAAFLADLPLAILGADGFDTETAVGNPFVGLELFTRTQGVSFTLGGRLPVASEGNSALAVGLLHDVDRFSAWLPEVIPVQGMINFQHRPENSGFMARVSGGPELWIATGDNLDSEFVVLYNAQLGYQGNYQGYPVSVMGGFGGLLIISEEGDFAERTLHQLTAAVNFVLGNVRPGVHVRLPLDEGLTDLVDYSIGLNLAVVLPQN